MAFIKNHRNCDCDCEDLDGPCDECDSCHDMYYVQFSGCQDSCFNHSSGSYCSSLKLSQLNGKSFVVYQPSYKYSTDTLIGEDLWVTCDEYSGAQNYECPCEYEEECQRFGSEYASIYMYCYPSDNRIDLFVDYVDDITYMGAIYKGSLKDGVTLDSDNFAPWFPSPSCVITLSTTPPP